MLLSTPIDNAITTFYKNLKIKFNADEETENKKYSLNIIFTFNVLYVP
jgi:hypothetical protein